MSHVAVARTVAGRPLITCLEAVRRAAKNLGMDVFERETYKWYGRFMGDYALPPGWRPEELGRNAVLVLAPSAETRKKLGVGADCYELAIVEDKNNPGCYVPMYDFWAGGHGLEAVIGAPAKDDKGNVVDVAPTFIQHYRMCADVLSAAEAGDEIEFEALPDGSWRSITRPNDTRLRE